MQLKNRIKKLEQILFRNTNNPGIVVETIDGELFINEEKSDPEAYRQFYHDVKLVYGNNSSEERS